MALECPFCSLSTGKEKRARYESLVKPTAPDYPAGRKVVRPSSAAVDAFWTLIKNEARQLIADTSGGSAESALMSDYVSESIIRWATLEEALANHLAEKLGTAVLSAAKWRPVLTRALAEGKHASGLTLGEVVQKDLETIRVRDLKKMIV